MSNIRLVKRRIRVAKNISQITRAMEMVAASKMRKAQEKAVSGKPYAQKIYEVTREVSDKAGEERQKMALLQSNQSPKILVILISSNKGLCGGLNTNLFRNINRWFPQDIQADYVTFGKKGEAFVVRTGRHLVADFSDSPFLDNIGALSELISSGFSKKEYREVWLIFNTFVTILNQTPTREMILPITKIEEEEGERVKSEPSDLLMEPDAYSLLRELLPHYLEVELRKAVLEAEASEHSARMIAMKNATDNAGQLMEELTLEYNKARQQLITYEIADIVTAREAMQ